VKVLFVFGGNPDDASNRYRCQHLCEALGAGGHAPQWASADQSAVRVEHELVVVHRLPWGGARRWVEAARKVGAGVVFSADDLVFTGEFAIHKGILHHTDPLQHRSATRSALGMAETIQNTDGVLASTAFLAQEAVAFGKPVHSVHNFPGQEILARSEQAFISRQRRMALRTDDRVLLGYLSGSATHDADLADAAGPLSEALSRHTNARLLVVGEVALPGALQRFEREGRVQRHPFVNWRELPSLLSTIDINLSPLDLTRPFCHAKSHVKWLEAAAVGVPTIASASAGLSETLTESDGCLLYRTDAQLLDALTVLIAAPERRGRLGELARASLLRRIAESPVQAAEALAPFAKTCTGSVVVRKPLSEKLWGRVWAAEASFFRRVHYLRRHFKEVSDRHRSGA
jgi:glycosyltransferase involved in cell wall biosynthesis